MTDSQGKPGTPGGNDWHEFAAPTGTQESPAAASRSATRSEVQARRRRQRRRRTAGVLGVVGVLLVGGGVVAYPHIEDTLRGVFRPAAEDYTADDATGETAEIVVPAGATGSDIAVLLEDADVVASAQAFRDVAANNPQAAGLQAGTFSLPTRIPAARALSILLDPSSRDEVVITIPEGFTITQVIDRVAAATDTPTEEVRAITEDPEALGLPAEAGGQAEGWFAPATYTFQPGDSPTEILATMVAQTVTRLESSGIASDQWQQILIKASIIEREVAQPEHFGMVARVLENRLAGAGETAGRLQMDSTVLYGVGKSGGIPTSEDMANDNPYNTYVHAGLPPTPIGSPGEAAITAAANPDEGDWLYFVTVNLDTGETKFASTLEEHNANVREFREWMGANG